MASAGRILIMPKGNYDSSVTYAMLDLVFYNGTSWIAKKTVVGVEPTETHSEYWHKLCESVDLTEIEDRIKALEDEEIDLSNYFEKTGGTITGDVILQKANNGKAIISKNHSAEGDYGTYIEDILADGTSAKLVVSASAGKESAAGFAFNNVWQRLFGEHNVQTLINALTTAGFGGGGSSSGIQIATGSYVGTNKHGEENKNSLTFGFEPKIVILSTGSFYDGVCIWHYGNPQVQMCTAGSSSKTSQLINFEQNGNTLSWWGINGPQYQLNQGATTYSWVAIG